uniref:Uncharacterized protein n=1 Tax=Anguilla anguilla TaxID=7936 RepID=A0A0E9TMC9_ANGAN
MVFLLFCPTPVQDLFGFELKCCS